MTLIVYALTVLQFVLPTGASLSSPHYTPNVSLSLSFFILVDCNPILLVAQANMLTSSSTLPFHTSHTIGQEILLTRPFKGQTLVTSHHLTATISVWAAIIFCLDYQEVLQWLPSSTLALSCASSAWIQSYPLKIQLRSYHSFAQNSPVPLHFTHNKSESP